MRVYSESRLDMTVWCDIFGLAFFEILCRGVWTDALGYAVILNVTPVTFLDMEQSSADKTRNEPALLYTSTRICQRTK